MVVSMILYHASLPEAAFIEAMNFHITRASFWDRSLRIKYHSRYFRIILNNTAGRYLSIFSSTTVLESDNTCIVYISEKQYYQFRYYRGFTKSRNSF